MPVVPGQVLLGKYRVDRLLGAGGMGVVVAATHLGLDQKVALKFLLSSTFAQDEAATHQPTAAQSCWKTRT
jgi:serine/threonine-protein kinase